MKYLFTGIIAAFVPGGIPIAIAAMIIKSLIATHAKKEDSMHTISDKSVASFIAILRALQDPASDRLAFQLTRNHWGWDRL